LIDVGNSMQAFPNQFEYAELNPSGALWPMHSADRMCDGKLLVDFIGEQAKHQHNPKPHARCLSNEIDASSRDMGRFLFSVF